MSWGGYSEGLAAVRLFDSSTGGPQCYYIDRKGRVVIAPQPNPVGAPFHEGLALARTAGGGNSGRREEFGYINRRGKLAISRLCHVARLDFSGFSEGLTALKTDTGSVYIDRTGRLALASREWFLASPFSEGLAAVATDSAGRWRWGFIDRRGRWAIQPQFIQAGKFSGGLASVVLEGNRWGYVNKRGELLGFPDSLEGASDH